MRARRIDRAGLQTEVAAQRQILDVEAAFARGPMQHVRGRRTVIGLQLRGHAACNPWRIDSIDSDRHGTAHCQLDQGSTA